MNFIQGVVFEGGGAKKGSVGIVIGIVVGMLGNGGRVNCGIVGMVGIVIDGWVGFGIVGKDGTFAWGNVGIVGKGGNVGFGKVGVVGFVVCRRWRVARLVSMFEMEIAMKNAKMKEL